MSEEKQIDPKFKEQISSFRPKKKKKRMIWRDEEIENNDFNKLKNESSSINSVKSTHAKKKVNLGDSFKNETVEINTDLFIRILDSKLNLSEIKCLLFILIMKGNKKSVSLTTYAFQKFIGTISRKKIKESLGLLEEKGFIFKELDSDEKEIGYSFL